MLQAMKDAEEAVHDAEKNSAGDKHETSRAMAHLEQEKLSLQFEELRKQKETLLRAERKTDGEGIGTMFITDKGIYFIAIAIGKILLHGQTCFIISPVSPAALALLGRKGDHIQLGITQVKLIDVC